MSRSNARALGSQLPAARSGGGSRGGPPAIVSSRVSSELGQLSKIRAAAAVVRGSGGLGVEEGRMYSACKDDARTRGKASLDLQTNWVSRESSLKASLDSSRPSVDTPQVHQYP